MKSLMITALAAAGILTTMGASADPATDKKAIIETYADIAHAGYEDSLIRARELQEAVNALIDSPGE